MDVTKKSLVGALKTTADLLDLLGVGDDPFRAQAFRSAARSLEGVQDEVDVLAGRAFAGIPKVGKAIAADLLEYVRTGVFGPLEDAASLIPAGVLSLFRVRGLGPKKIRALWDAGIDSLEGLREACRDGRVAGLKGFGAKSAASFLEAVEFALGAQERQHLSTAHEVAEGLCRVLDGLEPQVSGDVRRGLDTVRVARVTVTATPEGVQERLAGVVEGLEPVEK
ncbi:helix-hairpin-helix domain-containing protein, partial [Deinococcus sp. 12RED42]|uniref:helix-hairpin-helix domain-containing protein n=1 Tax=Deinococcus sp. 12RED42 TaxID=2745872 RepID=UPI001E5F9BC7